MSEGIEPKKSGVVSCDDMELGNKKSIQEVWNEAEDNMQGDFSEGDRAGNL